MLKEFRQVAIKGNVVDLAVGIIIGAAFNGVVNSFVNHIIMPIPGAILGKIDFSNFFLPLNGVAYTTLKAAKDAGAPTINYGLFINTVINFLIVAWAVFLLVRAINQTRRQAEGVPKEGPMNQECPYCHTSIPIKCQSDSLWHKATRSPNSTSDLTSAPATATT